MSGTKATEKTPTPDERRKETIWSNIPLHLKILFIIGSIVLSIGALVVGYDIAKIVDALKNIQ